MMYIYFNLTEGKLYANPNLGAFESFSLNRTKSILKCRMFALKHSMVSLNDETRKLKSVLSSLENQISKSQSQIKTVREIIIKRNKTLEMCEKQIREINTEAANIRKGMKRIVGSKRYPASKKYFTSSQHKNFDIIEYLESNFKRCCENTKKIEVEEKHQIEHHRNLENSLIIVKRNEKFKNRVRNQKENQLKFGGGKIRQGRVCKRRKMENIKAINENKTNTAISLYSSAFINFNKYHVGVKTTTVRSKERKVSVPLDKTSTNIKNRLEELPLNVDQTLFTLPSAMKIKFHKPSKPIIRVNIIYKKIPQKKYSRLTKSESEIIYSQGSRLLEGTSFGLTFSAKSEPKMSLQQDILNIKDRDDEVKIIYDSYYSQNCKECSKCNNLTQELKEKDSKEIEETKSDIKILSELDKTDLEQVYSNNIMETKLYKRMKMQIEATAQLKVFLNFKFESAISLITKSMQVVNISRLAKTIDNTKKRLADGVNQENDSDKVNDGTIERYIASCDQKTINSKTFSSKTLNKRTPAQLQLSKSMQEIIFPKIQLEFSMNNYSQLQNKILLSYQNICEESAGSENQKQKLYCREKTTNLSDNRRVPPEIKRCDSNNQTNSKPFRNINIHAETQTQSQEENYKAFPETRDQTTGTNLVKSQRNRSVYISGKMAQEQTQFKKFGSQNTAMRKKQLKKDVTGTLGSSIFNKKRQKDVKLREKSGAVEAVLPKRGKKIVGQRCKSLNNNQTIQGNVKMRRENQFNEKKNINNILGVKSIPELDTIEFDLREVVQQMTKQELEKFFKNQTDTVTSIKMEEAVTDTDSKLECEMNTINEEMNENEKRSQSIELLPVSDNINDDAVFNMIHSLENLQSCLSKCQTSENIQFPKENLEKLFTVFIELMTEFNEFRKSTSGVITKTESTSEDVNVNEGTIQESVPADYEEMESTMDECSEKLEVEEMNQQILIQKANSTEEIQFLDENDSGKEDINEEQIIIPQLGCLLDGNLEEIENTDLSTPPKHVRFEQNSSLELKSSSRCLKADRIQINQEKVDFGVLVKPNTKREFHASTSMTKSKVDFGTSFDLNKKYVSRPKTCTCNCVKPQNRGNFEIITELMRSMDKTHHLNKFNLKARDFQNNYDQYRICRTVSNLMRGLGDEQKVIGPTIKNCTGRCQKVTDDKEFPVGDLRKNNLGHGLISNLKQFNSRRQSVFEDLLPFGKRFALTPRRSYY